MMKRRREDMEIVWQTPANLPERHDYIFRDGVRYVRPYYFEFICHVKNRWARKTIVDMFADEFKGRPHEYYVSAVKSGRIQVDGEMVPISYVVQPSQKISHFLHRHEPPVMAWEVSILHKEPEVLTVCKPASVPVHPCGQYRKNTIVGILQAEHDLAPLFPIHRLDRLVSGLLILARSASKADLFRQQIEAGMVHKQYVAKVIGVFPEDEQVVNVNVNYNAQEGRSTVEVESVGIGGTKLKGKAACTKFTRISTNGTHSLVLCEPVTGRTHQIRVHLQYTGHPIANDMLYLSEEVVDRSNKGLGADRAVAKSAHSLPPVRDEECYTASTENSEEDFSIDPMCTNCPNLPPKGSDMTGVEEGLWLHCVRYTGPDWTYECPYPDWAMLG
ncbi:RNA pseudouridine synthase 7 isoform X4 [Actinidia eriantha]|uniref:RNA pseudouridine synthase 7 isoform X4 n=1 Tax=Actinidia eriantha TaxID=165200 RepID=UPI00258ED3FD|nr:RNA pseudouridine synthase 7 isoform X4 [Actinidia eriantha]